MLSRIAPLMDNSHMVSLFVLRANTCNHVRTAGERGRNSYAGSDVRKGCRIHKGAGPGQTRQRRRQLPASGPTRGWGAARVLLETQPHPVILQAKHQPASARVSRTGLIRMLHQHVEVAEVPLERIAQADRGGADRIVR